MRHRGHGKHHGGRHHGVFPWHYPYPYYYPTYYPYYYEEPVVPQWYGPEGCPTPLSSNCTQLNITPRWAGACFMPRYRYLRNVYGADAEALASAIAREEAPDCPFPAQSGAAAEYVRRIRLAVAVLLNSEGVPVRYPPPSPGPRPAEAAGIQQPWMRALLTGWT
jgi:hypothetical protein